MRAIFIHLFLAIVGFSCSSIGTPSEPDGEVLSNIREGMSEQEVLAILGQPDEIRQIPEDRLLHGVRILSSTSPESAEVYRWAYGVRVKGTFAGIGIVSFGRDKRVIWAYSPVYGCTRLAWKTNIPFSESEISTSKGMSCRLGPIGFTEEQGETVRGYDAEVILINKGKSEYCIQYDTVSINDLVIVEVYDSEKKLIFHENQIYSHSPYSFDESTWPVLRIPPGQSFTGSTYLSPDKYFGYLPPGRYYMRVCFPFDIEKWEYSPSNLVSFEVPPFPSEN